MGLDQLDINKIKHIFENLPSSWKQFLNKNDYCNVDNELNLEFQINEKKKIFVCCNIKDDL